MRFYFKIIFFLCVFPVLILGQNPNTLSPNGLKPPDFKHLLIGEKQVEKGMTSPIGLGKEIPGLKKPAIGVLASAVVPGTGEMYAGSWVKGAFFLGAEIALWVGYKRYYDKGQEWDDVFHVYANQHWSESRYWDFIANEAGINPKDYETLRSYEHDHYSHGLHVEKDQQYFEMIGKYDQFRAGWDDYMKGEPALTPRRNHYEDLRHNSNIQFKRASACAMVSLANHVLSAFDAAWTIKSINRKIESKMRTELKPVNGNVLPAYSFQLNW